MEFDKIYKSKDTKRNLCNSCKYSFAECSATTDDIVFGDGVGNDNVYECAKYEPKAEKHYRPFKDTDELIKVWDEKYRDIYGLERIDKGLDMPHIWVRQKECSKGGLLITYFGEDEVKTDMGFLTMSKLLSDYTFLDGSPCGV